LIVKEDKRMSWDELFNHPMLSDPHKLDEKEHKFEIDKET